LHQVDYAPAHHAVDGGHGVVLEHLSQGGPMRVGQDRLRAGALVVGVDCGQRQQSPGLTGILARARRLAKTGCIIVGTQWDWHGGLPRFAAIESD